MATTVYSNMSVFSTDDGKEGKKSPHTVLWEIKDFEEIMNMEHNGDPGLDIGEFGTESFYIGQSKWDMVILVKHYNENTKQFYTTVNLFQNYVSKSDERYVEGANWCFNAGFLMFILDSNQKYVEVPQNDSYWCKGRFFCDGARISHAYLSEHKDRFFQEGTLKLMFKIFIEKDDEKFKQMATEAMTMEFPKEMLVHASEMEMSNEVSTNFKKILHESDDSLLVGSEDDVKPSAQPKALEWKDETATTEETKASSLSSGKKKKVKKPPCARPGCLSRKTHRCSACLKVYFCSKECLELHWPIHKDDCVGVS